MGKNEAALYYLLRDIKARRLKKYLRCDSFIFTQGGSILSGNLHLEVELAHG